MDKSSNKVCEICGKPATNESFTEFVKIREEGQFDIYKPVATYYRCDDHPKEK